MSDALIETDVDGAGAVLHTSPASQRVVVIFLGGLGCTKEKLAFGRRRRVFEEAGHAVLLADHHNEGARRCSNSEAETNRGGWSRCQKDLFWRAIHLTAQGVPKLVDFCFKTFGSDVRVCAYGSSMGGDIFLTSLLNERRLCAVCLERASPDWLRPGSSGNTLGEFAEGDALYERHCPCKRTSVYVDHPTAVLFLCGASDLHVPTQCVADFVATVARMQSEAMPGKRPIEGNTRGSVCMDVLPSAGWLGHVLKDAADATTRALTFFGLWTARVEVPAMPQPPCSFSAATDLDTLLAETMSQFVCIFATAEWCVPCKRLLPGWRGLTEPDGESYSVFADRVHFAVADLTDEADENVGVDADFTVSEKLRITTLPTFLLFKRGIEVARVEGATHKRPARRLFAMLKSHVKDVPLVPEESKLRAVPWVTS